MTSMKIDGIIFNCIYNAKNISLDWYEYKNNIIQNLNNINFIDSIEDYIPCKRILYITRPKMRVLLYRLITNNNKLFKEVGYDKYVFKDEEINFSIVYTFIEGCIKILTKKQQCK